MGYLVYKQRERRKNPVVVWFRKKCKVISFQTGEIAATKAAQSQPHKATPKLCLDYAVGAAKMGFQLQ